MLEEDFKVAVLEFFALCLLPLVIVFVMKRVIFYVTAVLIS